ncbi:MAG: 30S ribosomal protein S20 [Eubacteriales bacterium]|jgi:small subunit ribosomal protein S20|uniref:Small ribosomal subunit protein bS20 n=1 Tax=Baileyella intestinalis TaxID=2606709 RepID=A0A6A8M5B1_9FIRM|nr:30S ribosomal protein S20 [Baileyella intestinalis]MCI7685469.1 30S ribosomal protein S20 [Clostridiales bacterium]MDD5874331.1 30S ribosomal protein S20 [Baileyella intestinalis]MDY2994853.1 30S ribosomal protein S20 [Baileyella intestinalis]MST68101.1 30S ribosomal protein S20 [Baileyella intestinalis]
MANIKSAKKRIKVIDKKTARNARIKNHVKEAEKAFMTAVAKGDVAEAEKTFAVAEKKIMQASAKGTMHKNTAARTVSRLNRRLNNLKADN